MAQYEVEVEYVQRKTITVYARDEDSAMEKAEEIVGRWDGVESAEALSADEI